MQASLTSTRVKQLEVLNSKATQDYVRIFENQRELKKRRNLGKNAVQPLGTFRRAESDDVNQAKSLEPSVNVLESSGKLLMKRPSVLNRSARLSILYNNKEDKEGFGLKEQASDPTLAITFRRSFLGVAKSKIDLKGSRDYLIKSMDKQKSKIANQSGRQSQSPLVESKTMVRPNYRPPTNVFQSNQNFNDFYVLPSSGRLRSLAISNLNNYDKEETEVVKASRKSYNNSFLSNLRLQKAEQTIQNILRLYGGDYKPKSPRRRHSFLNSSRLISKEIKRPDRDDDVKYQIYLDLEKSEAESKKALEKSFISLTDKSLKEDPKQSLKKGIPGPAAAYLNKIIAKANAAKEEEIK